MDFFFNRNLINICLVIFMVRTKNRDEKHEDDDMEDYL